MPRYHFRIHDGATAIECTSHEIATIDDVRREAVRQAASRLFDPQGVLRVPENWHLDVTDDAGAVLFRLVYPQFVEAGTTEP